MTAGQLKHKNQFGAELSPNEKPTLISPTETENFERLKNSVPGQPIPGKDTKAHFLPLTPDKRVNDKISNLVTMHLMCILKKYLV